MGASSRAAHAMAADAELLSRAAVAPRARGRVDARLHAVVPTAAPGRDPSFRVRAARASALPDVVPVVAALAGALGVARRAKSRIGASLHRVPSDEASAVKAGERDLVEREPRWQRRNRRDAVACGAGALRVAARTEVTSACGPDSVLAQPVAVMDEMTRGRGVFRSEVLVAAVAITKGPLISVLVAAEARGHLGPDHVWVLFRDGLVAPNTVAVRRYLVGPMLEAQMLAGEPRPLARSFGAMAPKAGVWVVRFRVASAAGRIRREVQRLDVTRGGDALVALDAIDPVRRVGAMLERVRRVAMAQAEHACACREGKRKREGDQEAERAPHGRAQLRERRASTWVSYRCSGVAEASIAAAASQPRRR